MMLSQTVNCISRECVICRKSSSGIRARGARMADRQKNSQYGNRLYRRIQLGVPLAVVFCFRRRAGCSRTRTPFRTVRTTVRTTARTTFRTTPISVGPSSGVSLLVNVKGLDLLPTCRTVPWHF